MVVGTMKINNGEPLMRYYVTADVHGYFSELMAALTEQGYFEDPQPHKLIVCGDLFDIFTNF